MAKKMLISPLFSALREKFSPLKTSTLLLGALSLGALAAQTPNQYIEMLPKYDSPEFKAILAQAAPGKSCDHSKVEDPNHDYTKDLDQLRKNVIALETRALPDEEVQHIINELIDPSLTKKNPDGSYTVSNGTKMDFEDSKLLYPLSKNILALAQAYKAKPDPFVLQVLLTTIETLETKWYYDGAPEMGNPWTYEIKFPKVLGVALILLSDDIPVELQQKLLYPTRYFQPNPYYGGMTPGAKYSSNKNLRMSTGGNRLDVALVTLYRGIIFRDAAEVQCALDSISDTVAIVEHSDGFYRDGSFIQHENIGYNGTYGKVLLNGFAVMKKLVQGTAFNYGTPEAQALFASFKDSYGYLMINGGITDAVSGRAVAKYNNKFGKAGDKAKIWYNRKDSESDLKRGQVIRRQFETLELDVPERDNNKYFYMMDKLVHRNKAGGAVVLSMHSNRIANFETINKDNPYGQYTGDGFTYIYGKDPKANISYFIDYNYHFVPGTTEVNLPIEAYKGERRETKALSSKDFVGAVNLSDNTQFVAFDYEPWNQKLSAQKSFIADQDGVFVLGYAKNLSDVAMYTTLDQRRMDYAALESSADMPLFDKLVAEGVSEEEARKQAQADFDKKRAQAPAQIFVDGKAVKENKTFIPAPKEVVFKDKAGSHITYKLYDLPNLKVTFENGFVRLVSDNKEQFSYAVYPQSKAPESSPYTVVKNTPSEQIITSKTKAGERTFMNFFSKEAHSFAGVKVNTALQVVTTKDAKGNLTLEVNDPTKTLKGEQVIVLEGDYFLAGSSAKDFVHSVTSQGDKTTIKVNLERQGESLTIKLSPKRLLPVNAK